MSEHFDTERAVARHIGSVGVSPPSDAFYDALFTRAGRARQRPRWLAILREPPMRYRSHVAFGSPIARLTTFAAVTILVTILGAGALVAGAQSPSPAPQTITPEPLDPMGANYWTGTWTFSAGDPASAVEGQVEADDPRIAGTMTQASSIREMASVDLSDGNVAIVSGTVRIDNDAGAWVGTWTGFSDGRSGDEWHVVEGTGAYEGLTSVYRWDSDGFSYEGVILPSELPALPDPVAPPTE